MLDCETCKAPDFEMGGAAGILLVRQDETKTGRPVTAVILHIDNLLTLQPVHGAYQVGPSTRVRTSADVLFVRHSRR